MFGDLDHFYDDEETLDLLRRYKEMLLQKNADFFDLYEFESIIDYFSEQYNFKDAINVVCMAIKQHPHDTSMKIRYAQLLIENLKPGKALRVINSLGNAENDNYELFLSKGIALNITGKSKEAQVAFNQALKLSEHFKDEVAYNIAQSYMQFSIYNTAVKYLLLAYHYNKSNILVLYDLGICYEKMNQYQKGIYYYRKYLELDPFAEHVWHNLGLLFSKSGEYGQAIDCFDYSIAINSQFVPAYFSKASAFKLCRSYSEAIAVYNELLIEDPTNAKALCDIGNCYFEMGNLKEAIQCFKLSMELSIDFADAWYGIGLVKFKTKKYHSGIQAFKKAIQADPLQGKYWSALGDIYHKARRYSKSIDAFSRAAELDPENLNIKLNLAQILFKKKHIHEAIFVLLKSYDKFSDDVQVNYKLAAYHAYLHRMFEAQLYFQKALNLNYKASVMIFKQFPKTRSIQVFQTLANQHLPHTQN